MAFSFSPSAGKALFASKDSSSSLHGRHSNDNTNTEQNFLKDVISSTPRRQLSSDNTDAFCSGECQGLSAKDNCDAFMLANELSSYNIDYFDFMVCLEINTLVLLH